MMKLRPLFLSLTILFYIGFIHAQEVKFSIINSSDRTITIRVDFPEMEFSEVDVEGSPMNIITMKEAFSVEIAGAPSVLKSTQSIIIPEGTTPVIEVINAYGDTFENFELAPSKGKLYRNVDPESVPYVKGEQYSVNAFYPEKIAELNDPYIFRDFHGVAVSCYPFRYNPVTKTLVKNNYVEIKISFQGSPTATSEKRVIKEFGEIYKSHFLNYDSTPTRYTPIKEDGDMLIITANTSGFAAALEPFKNWKIKNGINTEIVDLTTAGSTYTAIKNYIQSKYQANPNLAYVLLVGDNSNMPAYTSGWYNDIQDNRYVEVAGSDNYPDLFLGRMSATTVEHVTTQVEKAIIYESNPPVTSHFPKFCGIASEEGAGDDNEYDYQHIRNIGNKLLDYTYTSGYELFEGSKGGLDAAGNPSASMVSSTLNSGAGIINYCGHGSETSWVTSGFSTSNINSLTNTNMLPFIISVACVNGKYNHSSDCFAEKWLRAKTTSGYTGAVATVMSTINQPWDPPMRGQDEMIDIITESYTNNIKRTFGGICFNGFLKMLDVYNDYETYRTWLIFGDPSLMIRTKVPEILTATHAETIPSGMNTIIISSPEEGAKIVLTCNNTILDKGVIAGGEVTLTIPMLSVGDTIHVLASKYNFIPYQGIIKVVSPEGPYLITEGHVVKNQPGNIVNEIAFAETFSLFPSIKNYGNSAASNVSVTLEIDDEYITVLNPSISINNIPRGEMTSSNAFTFEVSPLTPDMHQVDFKINVSYHGEDAQEYSATLTVHSAVLSPDFYTIDDSNSGERANQSIDVRETVVVSFRLNNGGHAASKNGVATLQSLDGLLIVNENNVTVSSIASNQTGLANFTVSVNPACTVAAFASVRVNYNFSGLTLHKDYILPISQLVEDWETGNMTKFEWDLTALSPWELTTSNVYEGRYSARSKAIQNNSESMISITSYSLQSDSIFFYYYLSTQLDKGFLEFYIDNDLRLQSSGEVAWTYASFPVSEGTHTYKWKYKKSNVTAGGDDLAMIDYIRFPIASNLDFSKVSDTDDFNFVIFPNPTQDKFTIHTQNYLYADGKIMLYDVYGRLVISQTIQNELEEININRLSSGVYIVKVFDGKKELKNLKLIKQ